MCLAFQLYFVFHIISLCRNRSPELVADLQNTKRKLSSILEKLMTRQPYEIPKDFIRQIFPGYEVKKAAFLAIKQEAEAQEAAEEAEEKAKEAKAVAIYQ